MWACLLAIMFAALVGGAEPAAPQANQPAGPPLPEGKGKGRGRGRGRGRGYVHSEVTRERIRAARLNTLRNHESKRVDRLAGVVNPDVATKSLDVVFNGSSAAQGRSLLVDGEVVPLARARTSDGGLYKRSANRAAVSHILAQASGIKVARAMMETRMHP